MKAQFIDTNIILRYLTNGDSEKSERCYTLFKKAQHHKITLTTSESVVAEAVFVLASKKHYHLTPDEIKKCLSPILLLQGLKIEHRQTLVRALDLYVIYKLDFEDCLTLAHMERQQLKEIYSYDTDFDQATNVKRFEP